MSRAGATGDQPDLAAETRFWREWNTAVFERTHSREEAEQIAARLSPDPARLEALLARAQTTAALKQSARAHGDGVLIQIHADAGRFFQSRLQESWVPAYLAGRGLDAVLLPTSPWKIGYAPGSWTALTSHLRALGYDDDTMLRSGLVAEGKRGLRDRFRDRLMIPIRRADDRVVIAFVGRRHPDASDNRGPKYLNSPNTELYVKGHVLAGLAEERRFLDQGAQPVIVEGPMDAMAVSIAAPGTYVGVTTCGTALTPEQAALLARTVDLRASGIRLAFDPDTAGRKAALRAYAPLSQVTSGITAVTLPGQDPADLLQHQGRHLLKDTLTTSTRPLADLVVDARIEAWHHDGELESLETQFSAIRDAGRVIATMSPPEAAEQATRVAILFITRYGWIPEEATRELIEAAERHVPAPREGPAPARDPTAGLPPQTATIVAKATAPPSNRRTSSYRDPSVSEIQSRGATTNRQTGRSQRGD